MEVFRRLHRAGLPGVLISASPFHLEYLPFRRTRICVQAAREVFGPSGVLVWTGEMYHALSQIDETRTFCLEESAEWFGRKNAMDWVQAYPLSPHGRLVDAMRDAYRRKPAVEQSCYH